MYSLTLKTVLCHLLSKQNVACRASHNHKQHFPKKRHYVSLSSPFLISQLWTLYVQLPITSCGRQLSLGQSEKCAVLDEIVGTKHDIKFNSICSLDKVGSSTDHMGKENTDIPTTSVRNGASCDRV